jgi:hypothetical protein
MTIISSIKKSEGEPTPWFDSSRDGLPVRVGVYEGSAVGIPGTQGRGFQHGFYYWNGWEWDGFGRTASEAALRKGIILQASYWRGVIPGKDYPFASLVSPSRPNYLGRLVRTDSDYIEVRRLVVDHGEAVVKFSRFQGSEEAQDFSGTLKKDLSAYAGSLRAVVRGFPSQHQTKVTVSVRADGAMEAEVEFLLVTSPAAALRFYGRLG